jgi:hypothetical protein
VSDLSRVAECVDWIRAWRREASPARAARVITLAAVEQELNLRSWRECWGDSDRTREYAASVEILQQAARAS